MNYIYNAYHHFLTITKHKCEVMKNCFAVGLYRQGLLHDLSKYSWEEFATGVKYYQGNRSPNAAEKEEKGYSAAWLHHKGRNKHHFEYWIDFAPDKSWGLVGNKMPLCYLIEMVMDLSLIHIYHIDSVALFSRRVLRKCVIRRHKFHARFCERLFYLVQRPRALKMRLLIAAV